MQGNSKISEVLVRKVVAASWQMVVTLRVETENKLGIYHYRTCTPETTGF